MIRVYLLCLDSVWTFLDLSEESSRFDEGSLQVRMGKLGLLTALVTLVILAIVNLIFCVDVE